MILHRDVPDLAESLGIEEVDLARSVAFDQIPAVLGQPPAFAVVMKGFKQAEAEAVVDKGDMRLPGELDQRAAPWGESLGKVLAGHGRRLQYAPGRQVVHAQRRAPVQAGALVQMSVDVDEPLCVGARIVRIGVDDFVGVIRGGIGREGCCAKKQDCTKQEKETHRQLRV